MKSSTINVGLYYVSIFTIINIVNTQEIGPKYLYNKRFGNDSPHEILFPKEHPNDVEENLNDIPIEIIEDLQNISSADDFIKKYVDKNLQDESDELSNDFHGVDVARRASMVPQQAVCKPIDTVVELKPNNGSTDFLYFPTCTIMKRCAGCCASSVFECQPTETQMLNFEIFKTSAFRNGKFEKMTKEIVTKEQHDKCACQCRIKEEHCNKYQEYDPKNCQCNCVNYDAQRKCNSEHNKIWMPQNCTCSCRKYEDCTTGLYFNPNECRCVKSATTQLTPIVSDVVNRRQFIVRPILIDPDSNTNYNTAGQ